jgi:hypothetical protein
MAGWLLTGCGPKPPQQAAGGAAKPPSTNPPPPAATNTTSTNKWLAVFEDDPRLGGRDPFFPTANYRGQTGGVHVATDAAAGAKPAGPADLVLTDLGARIASINGVALAVGEQATVRVPGGATRIKVKLLQIKANSVVIEADGERRELTIR